MKQKILSLLMVSICGLFTSALAQSSYLIPFEREYYASWDGNGNIIGAGCNPSSTHDCKVRVTLRPNGEIAASLECAAGPFPIPTGDFPPTTDPQQIRTMIESKLDQGFPVQ